MYPSPISLQKRLIAIALLCAITFTSAVSPLVAFAQQTPNGGNQAGPNGSLFPGGTDSGGTNTNTQTTNFDIEDKQTEATVMPEVLVEAEKEQPAQKAAQDVSTGALTCAAGTLLANILMSAIQTMISELISSIVGEAATNLTLNADKVPTNPGGPLLDNTKLAVRTEKGTAGPFGLYLNVSWDMIAWCIVNAMIEYIANATIAWANSGFNGNPAFIENPERFFKDLADYSAGSIIRDIAYGASGGRVNVCQPFKITIAVGLAKSYRGSGNNALDSMFGNMSCRLSDITQNKFFGGVGVEVGQGGAGSQAFGNNAINWSDWIAVTQQDANNPYGSYILANKAMYSSVSAKTNELRFEVGLNDGWLNFKKCKDPKDPQTCNTTTPGKLIESSLNQTLGLSKQRLIMADKFDEMVTAIVNNLIKVALNKVLEEVEE